MEPWETSLTVELETGEREEDEQDPEDYDDYSTSEGE